MKIAIIGGNGFIGKYLVAQLHNDHNISLFTRQSQLDSSFEHINNLTAFCKQSYSTNELNEMLSGHDVVINLVGILNEKGRNGQGFYSAHVQLTKDIVNACINNSIPRYLHMSALNADAINGPSFYLRSKGEAENFVHSQHSDNFAVTSFSPSVIFGAGDSFCNRFAQLIKNIPFVFPLACAKARFAPIYAGDVAEAFIKSISNQESYNLNIKLCGPEIFTLHEIVDITANILGKKRQIIPMPDKVAYLQALFMDYCIPSKPFSIDNFNSLKVDSICNSPPLGKRLLENTAEDYLHLSLSEQNKKIMQL